MARKHSKKKCFAEKWKLALVKKLIKVFKIQPEQVYPNAMFIELPEQTVCRVGNKEIVTLGYALTFEHRLGDNSINSIAKQAWNELYSRAKQEGLLNLTEEKSTFGMNKQHFRYKLLLVFIKNS